MATKPRLAGFGLNWQHADTMVFASLSHSYEQYYQAIRRSWRFGADSGMSSLSLSASRDDTHDGA